MGLTRNKKIMLVILIILAVFFFPKVIATCGGERLCFGYVHSNIEKDTWLNVKDSTFEVRDRTVQTCIGPEWHYVWIFDGCPGSWGWYDAMPVDCDDEYLKICFFECQQTDPCVSNCEYCSNPDGYLRHGVSCPEWVRVCEEIQTNDKVPIVIENVTLTRVMITKDIYL